MIPPAMIRLKIREEGKRGFGLWLPILLLWPLFLILGLILLPFLFIGAVILRGPIRGPRLLFTFYELICSLRGLSVDVDGPGTKVKIFIW